MAEKFEGKIISGKDVALPTTNDYYHNSLYPFEDLKRTTEESFVYEETPLNGEDHIGFNTTGSVFTVKATKDSFLISDEDIYTGLVDGNTLHIDMSKVNVGTRASDINFFKQLKSKEKYKTYVYKKMHNSQNESFWDIVNKEIGETMIISLLMSYAPYCPTYEIQRLKKSDVDSNSIEFENIGKDISSYNYSKFVQEYELTKKKWHAINDVNKYTQIENKKSTLYFNHDKDQVIEYKPDENNKEYAYYLVLNKENNNSNDRKFAFKARNAVIEKIKAAEDIRICFSINSVNVSTSNYLEAYPIKYKERTITDKISNLLKETYNKHVSQHGRFKYSGFNLYGQNAYGRVGAVVYVKTLENGRLTWINLNKYINKQLSEYQSNDPQNINILNKFKETDVSTTFRPVTYDINNSNFIDNFWEMQNQEGSQENKREKIQKEAFEKAGHHLCQDDLRTWTVSLGDVSFFVPPTSIKMISKTMTERAPLMRAKGSMVKNIEKSDSELEIDLYFNEEHGINGQDINVPIWTNTKFENGKYITVESDIKETYYMNGLRSLISEFKFTPMLPIVNKYINETLNIFAVSLEGLSISTVPGFPRLIKATLLLKKFDYNVFMPELPKPFVKTNEFGEEYLVNPFAACINYDVLRHYYQKPLIYGNQLLNKINISSKETGWYNTNSIEFMRDTIYSNRTALMPCQFIDPTINISIANEDYLKKLLSLKKEITTSYITNLRLASKRGIINAYTANSVQKEVVRLMSSLYNNSTNFGLGALVEKYSAKKELFDEAVDECKKNSYKKFVLYDGNDGISYDKQLLSIPTHEIEAIKREYLILPFAEDLKKLKLQLFTTEGEYVINSVHVGTDNVIRLAINSPVGNHDEIEDLIDHLFEGSNYDSDIIDEVFEDNTIKIYLFSDSSNTVPDIEFARRCYLYGENLFNENQEASELKEAMDWENIRSLKFDLIGESIRVDSFSAEMANNFSRVSLLSSDGYGPQYLGSQDVHISWTITTKDANFAALMRSLPEYEAQCMRDYHLVLPCFPIRIDSEFTRMIGVYEVSIENVVVNTVNNTPGVYQISVRAISTDRTLRNREALKSLDTTDTTDDTHNGTSFSVDEGVSLVGMRTQTKIRTFDQLNNKLAAAELYPDLELPRIYELAKLGFQWIRYKDKIRDEEDLFVDPDFYFFYPHVIRSEIIKSAVKNYFQTISEDYINIADNTGAKAKTDANLNIIEVNKEFELAENDSTRISDAKSVYKNLSSKNTNSSGIPAAFMNETGKWDISPKIMVTCMEKNYLDVLQGIEKNNFSTEEEKKANAKSLEFVKSRIENVENGVNKLKRFLKETPVEFTGKGWQNILSEMGIDYNKIHSMVDDYIDAVIAVNCGENEYNTSFTFSSSWDGKSRSDNFFGYRRNSEKTAYELLEEGFDPNEVIEAGPYLIKKYSKGEFFEFIKEDCFNDGTEIKNYVLDPHYRTVDDINEYIVNCCKDKNYCEIAFIRIVLWWLVNLYDKKIFPSITMDVMRSFVHFTGESKRRALNIIEKIYGKNINDNSVDNDFMKTMEKFTDDNSGALDAGKMFVAFALAVYNKPLNIERNDIYALLNFRSYDLLKEKTISIISSEYKNKTSVHMSDTRLRRFLFALCGLEVISAVEYIGRYNTVTPAEKYITNTFTKIALEAANDPSTYIYHSFYDMCRGDYRGRMLRAFPTFYCLFMDEGREIGLWKLHDNFYSVNAINEISIVKSRKIASDTCEIILSNNYSTFTTDDEDGFINYRGGTFSELWENIFDEKGVAYRASKQRMAARKVNRAKLQPGIRIHIRQGYGSDARELGSTFNGVIAELEPGAQMIRIVAQGNGIELMNPIMTNRDADEIQYQDTPGDGINNTAGVGASPRKILSSFLTTRGGAMNRYVNGKYRKDQSFFRSGESDGEGFLDTVTEFFRQGYNDNPFGIKNFGDRNYTDIIPEGEIVQNIYEVAGLPCMDQNGINTRADFEVTDEAPFISFEPRGKTIWEIMHICKSVAPDYLTGITDFGFRSSIFFGKPHHYYAYDYTTVNGVRVEKRKPYQQYHIYYSDSDIINNTIKASSERVCTVATGLYQDKKVAITTNEDVGPLYVDKDIYSEFQKSILVDTKLKMKDGWMYKTAQGEREEWDYFFCEGAYTTFANIFQDVAGLVVGVPATAISYIAEDWMGLGFDEQGTWSHHKRIAWTATANALKNSVKEMYQGGITVLGDPTVKPNDRIIINDSYNDMSGQVLVREVVHNLNHRTGFTTTINVDAISTVDDRSEVYKNAKIADIVRTISSIALLHVNIYSLIEIGQEYIDDLSETTVGQTANEFYKAANNAADIKNIAKNSTKGFMTVKEFLSRMVYYAKEGKVNFGNLDGISQEESMKLAKEAYDSMINKINDFPFNLLEKGNGSTAVVQTAGKLGFKTFIIGLLRKFCFVLNVITFISDVVNNMLLWPVKNHQVLTVYPLRKNGMEYVAGLDGSKGLVYGALSYNDPGLMETVYADLLVPKDGDAWVIKFMKNMFLSDVVIEAASKYNRNFKYAHQMVGKNSTDETQIESLSVPVARKLNNQRINGIVAQSVIPRASLDTLDARNRKILSNALNPYYVENIETILRNEYDKNHCLVRHFEKLKDHLQSGFLKIIHENIDMNSVEAEDWEIIIGKKKVRFNGIKVRDTKNNDSFIDIPFLSKDALEVLKEICDYAKEKIISNTSDLTNADQYLNGNHIILKSGIRVGSKFKKFGAGYSFILQGVGDKLENGKLESICNEMYEKIQQELDKSRIKNTNKLDKRKSINSISFEDFDKNIIEEVKQKGLIISKLDKLNRPNMVTVKIDKKKLDENKKAPTERILINPVGWRKTTDDIFVKCSLISNNLSGLQNIKENIFVGTEHLKTNLLIPFEEKIKKYVDNNKEIIYRSSAIYEKESDVIPSKIKIEVMSLSGDGYKENVVFDNTQPGYEIDYSTGYVIFKTGTETPSTEENSYSPMFKVNSNYSDIIIDVRPKTPLGD